MPEYDSPVFKLLSNNDTGAASGHQGGFVVPKELAPYFPAIEGDISAARPTADTDITAELCVDGVGLDSVDTRYQYQTWGGERSPERRVTGNLGALRNQASKDDILIIQRDLDDLTYFRFSLVTKESPDYGRVLEQTGQKRWGVLQGEGVPVKNEELVDAQSKISESELSEFSPFVSKPRREVTGTTRKARNRAFSKRLFEIYDGKCAISGRSLITPDGAIGLDGAHVIPVEAGGTDDPRNGLLLNKDIHWAFDHGLLGIDEFRRVVIPGSVRAMEENSYLASFHECSVANANPAALAVHESALAWHRKFKLISN